MAFGNPEDPLIGKSLGDCLLVERIGRGGMGTVYRGREQSGGNPVAVKILSPLLAVEDAVVARFAREARAAARVQHPNVVRMLRFGQDGGMHYSVMDFVDGENLSELLKREGRLPVPRAVAIAVGAAKGLAALHAGGIIHRDVKPSNILLGRDGSVKVTDFGIARDVLDVQKLTATGDLLGTIGFAAPEQLQGPDVDARADLYSLGATLHYMLTGVRPPTDPRQPFAKLGAEVPVPLRDLVGRLLSRAPGDRPADAATLVSELTSGSPGRSFARRCGRAGLTVAGAFFAIGAGALASLSRTPGFQPEPWTLVLPAKGSFLLPATLFLAGTLLAFVALIRGRRQVDLGLRSLIGFLFLATSLVVMYLAGTAMGTLSAEEFRDAVLSPEPESLLAAALALAALGVSIGLRKPLLPTRWLLSTAMIVGALALATTASSAGSWTQAIGDLRDALTRDAWTWGAFAMAAAGLALVARHRGQLWQVVLGPLAVFVSVAMLYGSSQGAGSPPLQQALGGSGVEIAFALLLTLGARAVLDLRPMPPRPLQDAADFDTTGSSATPL